MAVVGILAATTSYNSAVGLSGDWSGDGQMSGRSTGLAVLLSMSTGKALLRLTSLVHGNSKSSKKKQHIYEIWDNSRSDVHKYGISGGALNANGSSPRANSQANRWNRIAGSIKFTTKVLYKNIPGRIRALAIEQALVNRYARSHGGKGPPGNIRPQPKL